MAMSAETATKRVATLLASYQKTRDVVAQHETRLADARVRLSELGDDLEMFAQHRGITPEMRQTVSHVLAGAVDGHPDVDETL